jgi:hypothetical protein
MSHWRLWSDTPPPPECVHDLQRGQPAFGVVARWLHLEVHGLVEKCGRFLVRAAREANPEMTNTHCTRACLQPVISVVFREWVATQPKSEVAHDVLTAFAQMCSDAVHDQAMTHIVQNATPPRPGAKLN